MLVSSNYCLPVVWFELWSKLLTNDWAGRYRPITGPGYINKRITGPGYINRPITGPGYISRLIPGPGYINRPIAGLGYINRPITGSVDMDQDLAL